ncbi:MAG: hypothetical protein Q8L37_07430 [Candidatus Gottesmanbacteria bacterium]|nr:hypothetical protein [Candidatus Gottesmanbacteria bacterium]
MSEFIAVNGWCAHLKNRHMGQTEYVSVKFEDVADDQGVRVGSEGVCMASSLEMRACGHACRTVKVTDRTDHALINSEGGYIEFEPSPAVEPTS